MWDEDEDEEDEDEKLMCKIVPLLAFPRFKTNGVFLLNGGAQTEFIYEISRKIYTWYIGRHYIGSCLKFWYV